MNKWCISLLVLLLLGLCFLLGYREGINHTQAPIESRDTITIVDTITIDHPYPVYKEVIRDHYEYIPVTDTLTINDTVYVAVQRERVVYQDSLYRAVISGIHPSLDSMQVYPRTTTITIREKEKASRWNLGIQAGVGYTGKIEPYIGIGLSYSLWQF